MLPKKCSRQKGWCGSGKQIWKLPILVCLISFSTENFNKTLTFSKTREKNWRLSADQAASVKREIELAFSLQDYVRSYNGCGLTYGCIFDRKLSDI